MLNYYQKLKDYLKSNYYQKLKDYLKSNYYQKMHNYDILIKGDQKHIEELSEKLNKIAGLMMKISDECRKNKNYWDMIGNNIIVKETNNYANSFQNKPYDLFIVLDNEAWLENFKKLESSHWNVIDENGISYDKHKFTEICENLWSGGEKSKKLGIKFSTIFNRYKKCEQTNSCSYAIITNSSCKKILLIRHCNSELWSLPGGKIEKGESFKDCIKRELYEEIGAVIRGNCNRYHFSNINKRQYCCYKITMNDYAQYSTNSPYEIAEIKWFDIDILENIKTTKLLQNEMSIIKQDAKK